MATRPRLVLNYHDGDHNYSGDMVITNVATNPVGTIILSPTDRSGFDILIFQFTFVKARVRHDLLLKTAYLLAPSDDKQQPSTVLALLTRERISEEDEYLYKPLLRLRGENLYINESRLTKIVDYLEKNATANFDWGEKLSQETVYIISRIDDLNSEAQNELKIICQALLNREAPGVRIFMNTVIMTTLTQEYLSLQATTNTHMMLLIALLMSLAAHNESIVIGENSDSWCHKMYQYLNA